MLDREGNPTARNILTEEVFVYQGPLGEEARGLGQITKGSGLVSVIVAHRKLQLTGGLKGSVATSLFAFGVNCSSASGLVTLDTAGSFFGSCTTLTWLTGLEGGVCTCTLEAVDVQLGRRRGGIEDCCA